MTSSDGIARSEPWHPIREAIWATGRNYAAALPEVANSRGTQVFTGAMVAVEVEDPTWVPVGGDVGDAGLPRVVRVERWTDPSGPAVVIRIDSSDGTPHAADVFLPGRTPAAVLRKLGLDRLVNYGAAFVARPREGPLSYQRPDADASSPFSMPVPDALREVRRARRSRTLDDTLALTVKAYTSTTGAGRIQAVADELGIEPRQAGRYKRIAQERGLIPWERKRAASKKKTTKAKG